ncbi:MAG: dihydrofolate reductase [Oceanospirillaceae bacterium]
MKLAIIVAQSNNRVIGKDNDLPWRLPKDLQYFKQVTLGKPIIMGRKTYESIGKPLPGRVNIVITNNKGFTAEGTQVVNSLQGAIELAESICKDAEQPEAMLIGGAQIYQQAISLADTLYITEVDAVIEGDAFFPEYDRADYSEQKRVKHLADVKNPYDYSFVVYQKIIKRLADD